MKLFWFFLFFLPSIASATATSYNVMDRPFSGGRTVMGGTTIANGGTATIAFVSTDTLDIAVMDITVSFTGVVTGALACRVYPMSDVNAGLAGATTWSITPPVGGIYALPTIWAPVGCHKITLTNNTGLTVTYIYSGVVGKDDR